MERLDAYRSYFARLVTSHAGLPPGSKLAEAFEAVPREKFLGPPPWKVFTPMGYVQAPSDDPACLYQDVMIALQAGRGLNNGQPTLHAACLAAVAPKEGEAVVHVGAGTGYYTAVLAYLVGDTGSVDAYEVEERLAKRAACNLADLPQVTVHQRSGAEGPVPGCDVLYVSAGATSPLDVWLDALRVNGRLLFPLTPDEGAGGMLLITRRTDERYEARFLCSVLFVPCIGARDYQTARKLEKAFRRGKWRDVRSLHRDDAPDKTCWFAGEDWWLSTAPNAPLAAVDNA